MSERLVLAVGVSLLVAAVAAAGSLAAAGDIGKKGPFASKAAASCGGNPFEEFCQPDLSIVKTPDHPAPWAVGSQQGYKITVQSVGSDVVPAGADVTVREHVPQGLTLTGISSGGWSCGGGGSEWSCDLVPSSDIPGQGWTVGVLDVNVTVDSLPPGGAATNCVDVAVRQFGKPLNDPNPGNNNFCTTAGIINPAPPPPPNLVPTKSVIGPPWAQGKDGQFTISIQNQGSGPLKQGTLVTVQDQAVFAYEALPPQAQPPQWNCNPWSGTSGTFAGVPITCTFTAPIDFPQGASLPPITVTEHVAVGASPTYSNCAIVIVAGLPPNQSCIAIPVSPCPKCAPQVLSGGNVTFGPAVAGKALTASMIVKNVKTGKPVKGQVSCTATLNRKPLPATRRSSDAKGRVSCTWKLPKTARGQRFTGTMTDAYKGAKVSRSFSAKVA